MFNNNMAGNNARTSLAENLASNERGDWHAQQQADQASMTSKNANKEQNIFDFASRGLAGVYKVASPVWLGMLLAGLRRTRLKTP
jgi:hypothetical protein